MTFLLTFVHPLFVVHAADRLVSRGGQPFDQESNKTVLFLARDGAGIVSYTGAALIGGRHTDEVIAASVLGEDATNGPLRGFALTLGGNRRIRDVGQVTLQIARGLRAAADGASVPDHDAPRFVAAGFKWKRHSPTMLRRIEPYIWIGIRRRGRGTYGMSSKPRHSRLWLEGLPREWISNAEGQALFSRAQAHGSDAPAVVNELVGTIREVAGHHPGLVGADAMTVIVPNPATSRTVTIRYEGLPSAFGGWLPWIITADTVVAPSQWSDGWHIPFPPWEIVTEGPGGPEAGMHSSTRSTPTR